MKNKYKVKLSEKVQGFRKGLSKQDKIKFDASIKEISEDPFKDAKPCNGDLITVLTILEDMGTDLETMTDIQKEEFKTKVKKEFGSEWKERVDILAKELR